jgi:hypothetical protein
MNARGHDLRSDEGIVFGRGDATTSRRGGKLPRVVVHAVRKRRQRGEKKDDQDNEQDSAHS